MSRPRPPYLLREKTRHGKFVWYVRRGDGPRIRIPHDYGSPGFAAAYHAAVQGVRPSAIVPGRAPPQSLAWLVSQYRQSTAWTVLSPATRRQRELVFLRVLKTAGAAPFTDVTRATIVASRDARKDTPSAARTFLKAMRGLFSWALDAQHVETDPTAGVKAAVRNKSGGIPMWTQEEVMAYERRWPIGTRERVWFDILLYTGLRRGDAVRLGRQHVRQGVATLYTEKSQGRVEVTLPLLPVLMATLEAGPCGDMTFVCGAARKPLTKESFGNMFREACNAAGVNKSAHGLRKAGATRAAENGATVPELEAIFGWEGGQMAALYTRAANRRKLSIRAMGKLVVKNEN